MSCVVVQRRWRYSSAKAKRPPPVYISPRDFATLAPPCPSPPPRPVSTPIAGPPPKHSRPIKRTRARGVSPALLPRGGRDHPRDLARTRTPNLVADDDVDNVDDQRRSTTSNNDEFARCRCTRLLIPQVLVLENFRDGTLSPASPF